MILLKTVTFNFGSIYHFDFLRNKKEPIICIDNVSREFRVFIRLI